MLGPLRRVGKRLQGGDEGARGRGSLLGVRALRFRLRAALRVQGSRRATAGRRGRGGRGNGGAPGNRRLPWRRAHNGPGRRRPRSNRRIPWRPAPNRRLRRRGANDIFVGPLHAEHWKHEEEARQGAPWGRHGPRPVGLRRLVARCLKLTSTLKFARPDGCFACPGCAAGEQHTKARSATHCPDDARITKAPPNGEHDAGQGEAGKGGHGRGQGRGRGKARAGPRQSAAPPGRTASVA